MNIETIIRKYHETWQNGPDGFSEDAPCAKCNDTGFLCDDCGQTVEDCDCKSYEIDGETFYREIGKCECQR